MPVTRIEEGFVQSGVVLITSITDAYGIYFDTTIELAKEAGLGVDESTFDNLMEEQKERSRGIGRPINDISNSELIHIAEKERKNDAKSIEVDDLDNLSVFCGYDTLEIETQVLRTKENLVILAKTPFFGESGGQIGDRGIISFEDKTIEVIDTQRNGNINVHFLATLATDLNNDSRIKAQVDTERRLSIMRNHSATHLLHNALRRILGTHVHQAGSLVAPDYLRFDFAHFAKLSEQEIADIEALVNEKIKENILRTPGLNNIPFEDAKKMGALMFFGDKYGDFVNVIQFGDFSTEFCGGTHVNSTGEIGYFKIRSEGSVASGVRRIEAVTGNYAVELLKEQEQDFYSRLHSSITQSNELAECSSAIIHMNGTPSIQIKDIVELEGNLNKLKQLPPVQTKASSFLAKSFIILHENEKKLSELNLQVLEARKSLEKEIAKVRLQSHSGSIDALVASAKEMDGIKIVASKVTASTADELKSLGDSLRSKLSSGVGLLACVIEDKVQLVCVVTDDLVATKKIEAGKVVGAIAKLVGGGGGGRPHMATAGGKDVAKLDDALAQTKSIVESLLRK